MVGRLIRRQLGLIALTGVVLSFVPRAVSAQAQGVAQGVVRDEKGVLVEGATVVFQAAGSTRKVEAKTNKNGEYQQMGLQPGTYTIAATKGDLVANPTNGRLGNTGTMKTDFILVDKKAAAAAAAAEAAKNTEFKTQFDAGIAAASANKNDEAIEKFTAAAAVNATCADCYANIGSAYLQKKDYDKAEAALKKSIEIKPSAGAYTALASVYTGQKKLDQASAAMAKATELSAASGGAAGGGNADAMFNTGVTLWNAGKIDDAKKQFQAAIAANPNHAEAHYQLGMALVNEGNLAGAKTEWETYLKLSPQGSHAAEVNGMLPMLK